MPGAKRHTLPGSFWGQPCILGSPAWICFWPLRSQHGLIHALSGGNPQVIISILFVSDTSSNMLLPRIAGVCQCWTMLDTRLWFADRNPSPQTQCLSLERLQRWRGFWKYTRVTILKTHAQLLVFPNDHNRLSTLKFRFLVFVCFRGEWSLPQLCDELSRHTTLRRHGQWDVETFRWRQIQIQLQIQIHTGCPKKMY